MEKTKDKVMIIIEDHWPVSITQISKHLKFFKKGMDERKRKAAIGKVSYHVKKLKEKDKIRTKKIGQTVVVWPHDIEKLRLVHELMK